MDMWHRHLIEVKFAIICNTRKSLMGLSTYSALRRDSVQTSLVASGNEKSCRGYLRRRTEGLTQTDPSFRLNSLERSLALGFVLLSEASTCPPKTPLDPTDFLLSTPVGSLKIPPPRRPSQSASIASFPNSLKLDCRAFKCDRGDSPTPSNKVPVAITPTVVSMDYHASPTLSVAEGGTVAEPVGFRRSSGS